MLFGLDDLFQLAFELTDPCCYGRNNGLSQPSTSYQSTIYYLFSVSHYLCGLVRSGIGIIVPISQLRSQKTRRVWECAEDTMKPGLGVQSSIPAPFPAALCLRAVPLRSASCPLSLRWALNQHTELVPRVPVPLPGVSWSLCPLLSLGLEGGLKHP